MTATNMNANGPALFQAPDEYLTQEQAGEVLGVTARTVYELIRKGKLRASKIGQRIVRVKRSDIDKMLSEFASF